MERLDDQTELQLLRTANLQFNDFFALFAERPVVGTQREVAALVGIEDTLKSVGAVLNITMGAEQRHAISEELGRYRRNLLRLRHELARMQQAAITSRAQLFVRLRHLSDAKAWCAAAKECS
jgi:hypothetical protein